MAFEAHSSRWRSALMLAGCLGFVALGIWLLGIDDDSVKRVVAAWAAIIVFGAFFLFGLPRLFKSGVEVRIDANGVLMRRWSAQTIPWDAIERIAVVQVHRQKMACLFLKDPSAYQSTTWQGKLARVNKSMGFGDISISVTGTTKSFDALMEAVARFAPGRLT